MEKKKQSRPKNSGPRLKEILERFIEQENLLREFDERVYKLERFAFGETIAKLQRKESRDATWGEMEKVGKEFNIQIGTKDGYRGSGRRRDDSDLRPIEGYRPGSVSPLLKLGAL